MAAPAAANEKITLAMLACTARRLADEVERLHSEFERTGALLRIQQFMELHAEGNPDFDMLAAAKNLCSYAGILSIIGRALPKPEVAPVKEARPRPPGTLPRKRGQQGNRVALSF